MMDLIANLSHAKFEEDEFKDQQICKLWLKESLYDFTYHHKWKCFEQKFHQFC